MRTPRFAIAVTLLAACSSKSSTDGLPPASDWSTGDVVPPPGIGPNAMPNTDVHGGGGGGNPHEGVAGAPPLGADQQQMPNDETHAFADPGNGGGGHEAQDVDHGAVPDPAAPIDPNKRIKGVFKVNPKVADRLKPGGAIFLIVKKPDAAGQPTGSAVAVDRVTWQAAGQGFELGFEDVTGDVIVMARYDQDLDASTKQPGDVVGQTRAKIPADNVVLELDSLLP